MKVSAGIFIKDNSVLLMRRAPNQPLAGAWEYPGGKFEDSETGQQCLRRELMEELGIDAEIGELVAHVCAPIDLYAYEILSYTGDIQLRVHDKMEWVKLSDLLAHSQLPADLVVSQELCNKKVD